jgi:geranylgeranyl diphosphate synthase, type II
MMMISLKQAQQIIKDEIKKIRFHSDPKELYNPIIYFLDLGGKRIRPALTLLGCNLFSEFITPAINPALALEIFHNFTLIHDDIMDNANLRRGQQTVHLRWNSNVALLSGDAMCVKAYEFLGKTEGKYLNDVLEVFTKTALQVCEGQQFDMNFESRQTVTEAEYLKMIELKTSVMFGACLKIGAITGGASAENANLLYDFGCNLGMAFQLQDDLLDVYGEESTLGKEIGKDIVSNKKTYLLIKALEISKGGQLESLRNWITLKKFNPDEKIKAIQLIYLSLGIKELTLSAIEKYYLKASEDLRKISVSDDNKLELKNFLFSLRNRRY